MFLDWPATCVDNGVAKLSCLPVVFHNVVSGFLLFVGAVALFMIIYSAIKFITSNGDQKQLDAARKMMTMAIVGTILVLSSFAILYFVGYITKSTPCITNIDSVATGGCK